MKSTDKTKEQLLKEIDQLKAKIAELEKNKEFFQIIAENTSDNIGITTFDLKAKYIYVSPSVKSVLGYDPEDLLGNSFFDFIHPEDKKALFPLLKKYVNLKIKKLLIGKESPINEIIEFRFKNKAGDWRFMQSTVNIAGKQLLAVAKDITERKQAELELQQSEGRFKRLFDDLGDAVYVTKIGGANKGRILEVNPAVVRQTGYTRNELLKMNIIRDLYISGSGEINTDDWEEKLNKGEIVTTTEKKKRKDGTEFWTEVIVTPIEFKGEKASLSINHDITDRKQAEEEMQKLAAVVKHSSEIINLSTLDGRMTFLNESGGKMLGIEPHEVENVNIMEVIPDHLIELVEKELLPALMKRGTWEGDLQYRNIKTGELTDVYAITFTVKDPDTGEPQFLANVSLDITERKQAEKELAKYREHLEELVKDRTQKLEEQNKELERLNKLFVNREFRIKELRDRVKELEEKISDI